MPLRGLVLLNVVHQHLQAAVYPAVVQVKAKAADFDRFATALVLTGVDAGVELVEDLVVTGKQRLLEDFSVAVVDRWFDGLGGDDDAGPDDRQGRLCFLRQQPRDGEQQQEDTGCASFKHAVLR